MQKKLLSTIIAGKLTVGISNAYAGGLGKTDSSDPAQVGTLSLTEIGAPYDIITTPNESLSGVIYTELAANQRIDFVIEGIAIDTPVNVYLAYSKAADKADLWVPFPEGQGQLELDPETLQIITALALAPNQVSGPGIMETPSTPLGAVDQNDEKIIVPVQLSDLQDLGADGEVIYFQAIAMPIGAEGEFLWDSAQATEVDAFTINRVALENSDYSGKICPATTDEGDSTTGDGGGTTDTGGKT